MTEYFYQLYTGLWNPRDGDWSLALQGSYATQAEAETVAKTYRHCPWSIVECRKIKSGNRFAVPPGATAALNVA